MTPFDVAMGAALLGAVVAGFGSGWHAALWYAQRELARKLDRVQARMADPVDTARKRWRVVRYGYDGGLVGRTVVPVGATHSEVYRHLCAQHPGAAIHGWCDDNATEEV